jgi:hypothetical protein
MSVFMEKSGVREWSPNFFRAEGLKLQTARLPFGRASPESPTYPCSRAQVPGPKRSNLKMNVICL